MIKTVKGANQPATLDKVVTIKPTPRAMRLREDFLGIKPSASIDRARIETRVITCDNLS